jgi:hypothetical protein
LSRSAPTIPSKRKTSLNIPENDDNSDDDDEGATYNPGDRGRKKAKLVPVVDDLSRFLPAAQLTRLGVPSNISLDRFLDNFGEYRGRDGRTKLKREFESIKSDEGRRTRKVENLVRKWKEGQE